MPIYKPITTRLAITCCKDRGDETLVLLKSALLFSQDANLEVYVVADQMCGPIVTQGVAGIFHTVP